MTAAAESTITFDGRFARELSELAVPWQAEEAPDPSLLVL
ncbi:MAG: YdiU family protein, partial [Pseudarthrobacter sp.]|nr:YdiU family protein [Pseudarthrobacter sp.]